MQRVIIDVMGGVASVVSLPDGIEVEIRDYDVPDYDTPDEDVKIDKNGDRYVEILISK